MSDGLDHWSFFQLPPFFTAQPAAVTLQRQTELWANLLLDHASHHARQSPSGTSRVLRFYHTNSEIFYNPRLSRRLPSDGARAMLEALVAGHPNRAVVVADEGGELSVLVTTNAGGMKELEESLLAWIMEMGQGTTTAMLMKNGAVMTFDELAEGRCLEYKQPKDHFAPRLSGDAVPVADVGALTEEQAVRTLLQSLNNRPVSIMRPFKITLFNMDGSEKQPYDGVKFGGA